MQGFLSGGWDCRCSSSSVASSSQQPFLTAGNALEFGGRPLKLFTLPCNLHGVKLFVTLEVDGGNLDSAKHNVLSSLNTQNMGKSLVVLKPFGLNLLQCKHDQNGLPVVL